MSSVFSARSEGRKQRGEATIQASEVPRAVAAATSTAAALDLTASDAIALGTSWTPAPARFLHPKPEETDRRSLPGHHQNIRARWSKRGSGEELRSPTSALRDGCHADSGDLFPQPPPPGVSMRRTSPARSSTVPLSSSRWARDSSPPGSSQFSPVAPGSPPARPHGRLRRRSVIRLAVQWTPPRPSRPASSGLWNVAGVDTFYAITSSVPTMPMAACPWTEHLML